MVKCAVEGCTNYQGKRQADDKRTRFFCFPKDYRFRVKWIAACGGRDILNIRIARICSDHFTEKDWKLEHQLLNVSDDKKRLKSGAIPTQNVCHDQGLKNNEMEINSCCDGSSPRKVEQEPQRTTSENDEAEQESFIQVDVSQTPCVINASDLHKKGPIHDFNNLQKLRLENRNLRLKAAKLLKHLQKSEPIVGKLGKFLTKAQIKRLQHPRKNCCWNMEDIRNAVSIYTSSPPMYKMLWTRKYPLPSPSTLRKYVSTLKLRPGTINSTIKNLTDCNYNGRQRLCILAFYEIKLRTPPIKSESLDSGLRPYKFAQVFIVRGLFSEWKHIIYYNFDCMMLKLVIQDIIRSLRDIHFTVVAIVSGVGARKLALWQELQIDEHHPSFEIFEGEKVFFFANVPHLLKRLRNHFLKTGLEISGKSINVEPLNKLLAVQPDELWVSHDLTQTHINPKRIGQHNLQVVLQLFSTSVATAIRKCVAMGKMFPANAIELSDFIQVVDQWFGVFNAKRITDEGDKRPLAYGLALREQNAIIASMSTLTKNLRLTDSDWTTLYPVQKGTLLNNTSLPLLHKYLKEKHNISYVITNNLNPDDIEHSFGLRQSLSGVALKPTPLEFKYRVRSGILVNLSVNK